ncbi:ABC transporter six-transmembrane domain-containing protein [Kiloniella laminariae]|uniref:ABC transporter six-transmembrane domain-containing protein n=1 Tax=Kiloniella laminariae TaxID=454162 RepID=UPI00037DA0CE|nr:ABC transporter six-transmembrane domain-containing protein [Kiloniella laminariae]
MIEDRTLTITALLTTFLRPILVTWLLTLCETALTALIPLFIGFAIDGLLDNNTEALQQLALVLAALMGVAVARRVYDTRVYGTIRVEVGKVQVARARKVPVSTLNARLGMARELVDFLELEIPGIMNSGVQIVVSLIILYIFHPALSCAALVATALAILFYGLCHHRFYRLNADHNQQVEQQVKILEEKSDQAVLSHFTRLRKIEIKLSDTEAWVYGAIFTVFLGFIVFNLWFAATNIETTAGTIFSIINYSWEFVESALVLPMALQSWSRLSEITQRINNAD